MTPIEGSDTTAGAAGGAAALSALPAAPLPAHAAIRSDEMQRRALSQREWLQQHDFQRRASGGPAVNYMHAASAGTVQPDSLPVLAYPASSAPPPIANGVGPIPASPFPDSSSSSLGPDPLDLSHDSLASANSAMQCPSPTSSVYSALSDLSLPHTPLSRDVSLGGLSLNEQQQLHHSFSQPELYRMALEIASPSHPQHPYLQHLVRLQSEEDAPLERTQQQMQEEHDALYDSAGEADGAEQDDNMATATNQRSDDLYETAGDPQALPAGYQSADAQTADDTTTAETNDTEGSAENEGSPLLPRTASAPKRRLSDASDASSEDSELGELSRLQLIGLCLPAAAVMVGWAVGEALLLPYLLSLGVSPSVANFAFLINPLFGLFLQPLFGRWSDHCTLRWGRRRPFMLLFCLGSILGLSLVVWSAQVAYLLSGGQMGKGSMLQVVFVFVGFALMDLSHDLLLMPARALLNDRLPDEQTDQGNAYFACISSLGSCVGLALTIVPLELYYPFSLLTLPVRATFTTATVVIAACNFTTLCMSAGVDEPYVPEGEEGEGEDEEEEESPTESTSLLKAQSHSKYGSASARHAPAETPGASALSLAAADLEAQGELATPVALVPAPVRSESAKVLPVARAASPEPPQRWLCCFAENPLSGIGEAFSILPRPLKFIWLLQLVWWYCALHVNLWWTSWVVVELYGGSSPETEAAHHNEQHEAASGDSLDPQTAVRLATAGLLLQAVLSFPASAALPYFNRVVGITNFYHMSAIVYGLAVLAIGLVDTYMETLLIMAVSGLALPPIFSSSYILVEVYASEGDEEEEEESEDEEEEGDEEEGEEGQETAEGQTAREGQQTAMAAPLSEGAMRRTPSVPSNSDTPDPLRSPPASALAPSRNNSSSRRHSQLQVTAGTDSARGTTATASPSEHEEAGGSGSEFTAATLESKRGTITALFNITMIIAQSIVGVGSGFLIDYVGNITIVFYVSGLLLVTSNAVVLFLRLSKPPEEREDEEEEEEEEESSKEAKLEAVAKQQRTAARVERPKQILRPNAQASGSPPLQEYLQSFEQVPHVASGLAGDAQWVRPVGEKEHRPSQRHHHHPGMAPMPTGGLPSLRRTQLTRSSSAPDVRLARRFLRKKRQAKAAAAAGKQAAAPAPPRAALFQPHAGPAHGVSLGMRNDLLRGGRPRLRPSRNARVEVDQGSEAGSQASATAARAAGANMTAAQQAAAVAAGQMRQQMRDAHNKRMEERLLEQLRERARLFGIKVATRAAQLKASRAAAKAAKRSGAPHPSQQQQSWAAVAAGAARRNNQVAREQSAAMMVPQPHRRPRPLHHQQHHGHEEEVPEERKEAPPSGASSLLSVAAGSGSGTRDRPHERPLSGGRLVGMADAAEFERSTGRVHWTPVAGRAASGSSNRLPVLSPQGGIPLPAPGSEMERVLIEQLAEASLLQDAQPPMLLLPGGTEHMLYSTSPVVPTGGSDTSAGMAAEPILLLPSQSRLASLSGGGGSGTASPQLASASSSFDESFEDELRLSSSLPLPTSPDEEL